MMNPEILKRMADAIADAVTGADGKPSTKALQQMRASVKSYEAGAHSAFNDLTEKWVEEVMFKSITREIYCDLRTGLVAFVLCYQGKRYAGITVELKGAGKMERQDLVPQPALDLLLQDMRLIAKMEKLP